MSQAVTEEMVQPDGALSTSIDPNAPEAHAHFRRRFHLDAVPAHITADSRYALFVNGQEVCRGPVRRLHYDLPRIQV